MVAKKGTAVRGQEQWSQLHSEIERLTPHLYAFLNDVDDFRELRIKANSDGTHLAIAKGYDNGGGPVVCFGVGYGAIACLLAIDATINGGRWKFDKPWDNGPSSTKVDG